MLRLTVSRYRPKPDIGEETVLDYKGIFMEEFIQFHRNAKSQKDY